MIDLLLDLALRKKNLFEVLFVLCRKNFRQMDKFSILTNKLDMQPFLGRESECLKLDWATFSQIKVSWTFRRSISPLMVPSYLFLTFPIHKQL